MGQNRRRNEASENEEYDTAEDGEDRNRGNDFKCAGKIQRFSTFKFEVRGAYESLGNLDLCMNGIREEIEILGKWTVGKNMKYFRNRMFGGIYGKFATTRQTHRCK